MANKKQPHEPRRRGVIRRRHARHRPARRGVRPAAGAAASLPSAAFDPFVAFPLVPPPTEDPHALEPCEVLFGGQPHIVRPLSPADEGRLISFFNSHTEETIRQRYGYHIAEMTPERARRLVGVDQSRDAALGVFERAPDGGEVLHAVGRYLLDADGRSAEVAFVVRESKRNLGVCTALLRRLLHIARLRGMGHLHAQVQADNTPMLSIFRRHGGRMKPILGADAVEAFVPTAPPRPAAPGA
jgi:RimJ/RimL family protein N-acetyltransferase